MENSFSNVSLNSSEPKRCGFGQLYFTVLSLMDVIPLVLGQPVIIRFLSITFASKKATDILNFNLALFHNLQYLISLVHLSVLFLQQKVQTAILTFLLVYAQTGGPMSLSFICMERYVAVIHPTSYPLLKKYRFREVCVASVWLLSVPLALMNLVTTALSPLKKAVAKIIPCCMLVAMTAMMVRSSITVALALRRSSPGRDEMHPVKRRAFKTVCATSATVFIFYIPVLSLQMLKFVNENKFDCLVPPLCILLMSVASVVHPLLYLSTHGKLFTCIK